jgi:carbon monoxide dehydrogenase subunit G
VFSIFLFVDKKTNRIQIPFTHISPLTIHHKEMYTIRAAYSEQFDIKTSLKKAHEYFLDLKNFIELMPNVESIHTDGKGITRWTIRDEIPLIGSMKQTFPVMLTENSPERIEWSPLGEERQNFLRYSADFFEKTDDLVQVKISQSVEIRRDSARQLHPLAGLAGERAVSAGMQRRVAEMIKTFMRKSKEKLEK